MALIKLNYSNYTSQTYTNNKPSEYHTYRQGNLVTYKDSDGIIYCDIILASYGDNEIRIMSGNVSYWEVRHADLYEIATHGLPTPIVKDNFTEQDIIMSCKEAREFIQKPETILKSVEVVDGDNTLVKLTIFTIKN